MKFLETLKALPLPRQLMLAGAVLGVVLAMMFMVRGAMNEPMSLLYSGLDSERSGEIMGELDKQGVSYQIRQDAIFVPQSARDRIRMSLAQQGLPRPSVKGYELLDDVNGFSVTSEMYKASYWRAKEGELTRTILAIPGVESARVHIGANLRSGFTRAQQNPTASVTLTSSRDLSQPQAQGIQYMVALAVPALSPDDVAVIDSRYGILIGPNTSKAQMPGIMAEDKASALEMKIMSMLEARLGPGNARVNATVDVTRELERIESVRIDPESRVIRQRTVNDTSETSTNAAGGGLTVASNLPDGAGAGGGGASDVRNSSESVAYEFNETRVATERLPGEVKRISVAVLLNETALGLQDSPDAEAIIQSTIAEFEQLIATSAGLNADRGDVVTVELMPFRPIEVAELTPMPSMVERLIEQHLWSGVQMVLLALVVIALALGVIRPIFAAGDKAVAAGAGENDPLANGEDAANPINYLQDYAAQRQDETAALLEQWLAEDRKVAVNE
ncbi:flagellar basal-body MS-ring/collar protein FliF [Hyphomonas sp. FCG-A18]|uniref:flagellar basal-body MS-ring/collar protein FliF n=1 Tax=Hyphomonas sp. FCG-A18 TaxID=3080019 RepID=UPI002B2D437A|nr:flagellar basal-body MS-ring/collar protein FliF [Hyphomonas sp. FCG-A18]